MREVSEKSRKIATRLAYLVPTTPWPIVFWLQTFPMSSFGAGSRNALAFLATPLVAVLFATAGVGLALALYARKSWEDVGVWGIVAFLHHFLLFEYIAANVRSTSIK